MQEEALACAISVIGINYPHGTHGTPAGTWLLELASASPGCFQVAAVDCEEPLGRFASAAARGWSHRASSPAHHTTVTTLSSVRAAVSDARPETATTTKRTARPARHELLSQDGGQSVQIRRDPNLNPSTTDSRLHGSVDTELQIPQLTRADPLRIRAPLECDMLGTPPDEVVNSRCSPGNDA